MAGAALTAVWRLLGLHHLGTSRERFLLLRQFLHHFAKVDNLVGLDTFRGQLVLRAQESFPSCTELWEAVIHHLLRPINVDGPHLVELIDSLLRDSFIEVPLLTSQVAQVVVHFGQRCRLLVDLLIGGLAFGEYTEAEIHAVRDVLGCLGADSFPNVRLGSYRIKVARCHDLDLM